MKYIDDSIILQLKHWGEKEKVHKCYHSRYLKLLYLQLNSNKNRGAVTELLTLIFLKIMSYNTDAKSISITNVKTHNFILCNKITLLYLYVYNMYA